MARHSNYLRRRKSSAAAAALIHLSMTHPTFPSPMHSICPLPALDRTVVNISKNSRGQHGSIPCSESYAPRDELLLPPTKTNISTTVASLLSRPDTRLTPVSNFPSRELPLPGVRPQSLDRAEDEYFGVNTVVLVRRFNTKSREWSKWRRGVVREVKKATYLLGTYALEYRVHCLEMPSTSESYVAFLGEICNPTRVLPDISPEEYSLRVLRKSQVYARLPRRVACDEERTLYIWTPSIVTGFENGKISEVQPLERSDSSPLKYIVRPHEILPYSPETARICLESGHHVMSEDGRIFGPPLSPNNIPGTESSEGSTSA